MELRELPVREKTTLKEKRQGKLQFVCEFEVRADTASYEEPVATKERIGILHPHFDITRSLPNRNHPRAFQDPER